jgi:hypothetical protein
MYLTKVELELQNPARQAGIGNGGCAYLARFAGFLAGCLGVGGVVKNRTAMSSIVIGLGSLGFRCASALVMAGV